MSAFKTKTFQIRFRLGLHPSTAGELTTLSETPKVLLFKGKRGRGDKVSEGEKGKQGKADDLYRGSLQFENRRRTALQYPPCSLDHMPRPTIRRFLAWRPSQATKLYCLVNRGTLGVNNLPRVVARIMPRPESNPRPLIACRWSSLFSTSVIRSQTGDCCYIACISRGFRHNAVTSPFGVAWRRRSRDHLISRGPFPIGGLLEPNLISNGFRGSQRRMWCNGWRDRKRPLNKGQRHSFWYQSIPRIRLSVVTSALRRTV